MAPTNIITFNVTRRNPELIPPAKPTPHEFKPLSDIDDPERLRFHVPFIQFYRNNSTMKGKDPVRVVREAIAKALVFYYPLAGRLREIATRKLVVECTGEGVMFIEADADITLEEFGDELCPPFPCVDELLYDVPGSSGIINCPLLLFQVTRLKCGGFILAFRMNHTMMDGSGLIQFLSGVAEIGRGARIPSVQPIWQRHLFNARSPPYISCTHHEYDVVHDNQGKGASLVPVDDIVQRFFFFGIAKISALRNHLPLHLRDCTTVQLLTACLWRCRTIAISPHPTEEVRVSCVVDLRKSSNPPPIGYYGNAVVAPAAITTAKELSDNPLHFALELVKEIKSKATEEYVKSVADLMVLRGRRPKLIVGRNFVVSDISRSGFRHLDFGWGEAVYGGITGSVPGVSHYISLKNYKGENGILVPICLPAKAMEVFERQIEMMVNKDNDGPAMQSTHFIKSAI